MSEKSIKDMLKDYKPKSRINYGNALNVKKPERPKLPYQESKEEILENTKSVSNIGSMAIFLNPKQIDIINLMKSSSLSEYICNLAISEFLVVNGYFKKGTDRFLPTDKLVKEIVEMEKNDKT